MKKLSLMLILLSFGLILQAQNLNLQKAKIYPDDPFIQDYSIKFSYDDPESKLLNVVSDRNGYIQVLSKDGLLRTREGQFLFLVDLVVDLNVRTPSEKNIKAIDGIQN